MSAATRDRQTKQDLTLNRGWVGGGEWWGVQGGAGTLPAKINRLKDEGSGRRGELKTICTQTAALTLLLQFTRQVCQVRYQAAKGSKTCKLNYH